MRVTSELLNFSYPFCDIRKEEIHFSFMYLLSCQFSPNNFSSNVHKALISNVMLLITTEEKHSIQMNFMLF